MLLEHLGDTLKMLRRGPLAAKGEPVSLGVDAVERLIPHREPMRLVDALDRVDLDRPAVAGRRTLRADDPVFAGHFPADPVYPGVLVVEAMGQLAATLTHFVSTGTLEVGADASPQPLRATRIHHAAFFAPFVPGDTMALHAAVVDDSWTLIAAAQAYRNDELAAVAVLEVLIHD
jgi:3-hydroxymyristoyl/3-hydroxydecanoyl-(acyl carrier protein) dehydratase